jgi:alpha-beta hydrolase superfamily lysophospholipase
MLFVKEIKVIKYLWYVGSLALVTAPSIGLYGAQPVLFVHGIADTYKQAFRYYNLGMFSRPFYTFNFPDATEGFTRVDRAKTTFGQEDELAYLQYAYQKVTHRQPDQGIVLYGISRGAVTILNFLALQKPDSVKAIILESPFAAFDDVIENISKACGLNPVPLVCRIVRGIASVVFPRYNWQGIKPIDLIAEIPQDLPILLVRSQEDQLVPCSSTERLYEELCKAGCTKVHLLKLPLGRHGKLFLSPSVWQMYKEGVRAFCQRYLGNTYIVR